VLARGSVQETDVGRRMLLVVVFISVMPITFSQGLFFSVFPPTGRAIGFSDLQIGVASAVPSAAFLVSVLLLGLISGKVSRYACLLIGLGVSLATNTVIGATIDAALNGSLSPDFAYCIVLVSRTVMAVSWAGMMPAAQGCAIDLSTRSRTGAASAIGIAFATGMVAAPLFTSLFASSGGSLPFYFAAAMIVVPLTALSVCAMVFKVTPVEQAATAIEPEPDAGSVAAYLAICFLVLCTSTGFQQVVAFRLQDRFGLTVEETSRFAGSALFYLSVTMLIAQITVGIAVGYVNGGRRAVRNVLMLGCLASALSLLGILLLPNADLGQSTILIGSFGVGLGCLFGGTNASIPIVARHVGAMRAAARVYFMQGVGASLGPVGSVMLYRREPLAAFWLPVLLLTLVFLMARQSSRESSTTSAAN
jgi:MFS family permease